jgi:hypothetical protein
LIVDDLMTIFQDPASHDFRLRQGSPAVDAGTEALAPKIDIIGTARPQGDAFDIGAYEHPTE